MKLVYYRRLPDALVCILALVTAGMVAGPAPGATVSYQQLHSFGFPELMGELPGDPPIQASDGFLYGTAGSGGQFDRGVVYRLNPDGTGYRAFLHLGGAAGDAENPLSSLTEGSDGALYGVAYWGGDNEVGAVFKLNKDGSGYTLLHHFGLGVDGQNPRGRLLRGSDGLLYGTTLYGGLDDYGTVFRLREDGNAYEVVQHFLDEEYPLDGVVEGSDGLLYGVTAAGGDFSGGVVYQMNKNGSGYNVLYSFAGDADDGLYPYGGLIEGSDGGLYGTTRYGGLTDFGIVFRLTKDGLNFTILDDFGLSTYDGESPEARLLEGRDGALYGTTTEGGTNGYGTVFCLNKNGTGYTLLHHFDPMAFDANGPESALLEATNGLLIGVTRLGGQSDRGALFTLHKDGSSYGQVHSFNVTGGDGQYGWSSVIEGSDGFIYGACVNGGFFDSGIVFKMRKDGSSYSVLHQFTPGPTNGVTPWGHVIEGRDGLLYGATRHGGAADAGTIFKLHKDGSGFALVRSFTTNNPGEGAFPLNGVIEASDGRLYGRTISGGAGDNHAIFRINKDGSSYTNLHSFSVKLSDYYVPASGLIEGTDGALYGTTPNEGAFGAGSVFKVNKDGSSFRTLHDFATNGLDGSYPTAPNLFEASNGRLYGATDYGGIYDWGALFSLNKDGSGYAVLHSFSADGDDAYSPSATVVEGPGGLLYGTSYYDATLDSGTIYAIGKDGSDFSIIYRFSYDATDGFNPNAELIRASDGALYGTTFFGGEFANGTVFRIMPVGLSVHPLANGISVSLSGFIGHRYALEGVVTPSSPWTQIVTVTNVAGSVEFLDTNVTLHRFYRARILAP